MKLREFLPDEARLIRAVIRKVREVPPTWDDMDITDDGTCLCVALASWLNALVLHEAAVAECETQLVEDEMKARRGALDS